MSTSDTEPTTPPDVLTEDDHARGCAGREYECTCGYDSRVFDEIARLRLKLSNIAKHTTDPWAKKEAAHG